MRKLAVFIVLAAVMTVLIGCNSKKQIVQPIKTDTPTISSNNLLSKNPNASPSKDSPIDLKKYSGAWYSTDYKKIKDSNGEAVPVGSEMNLDMSEDGKANTMQLTSTSLPPASRFASLESKFSLEDNEDKGSFEFGDDGWGNSGTGTIKLGQDKIVVEIKLKNSSNENWGIFEGSKTFVRKP